MEIATAQEMSDKLYTFPDKKIEDINQIVGDNPDSDTIKMFVGQVPRSMNEEDLRIFFEEYGSVHQLNILKDKSSQVSRGCCFVTFYKRKDALNAQNALHNLKTLPGMHHPVQMKPADTENRNERKIFIGMVSKKFGEEEIKQMFEQFGNVEDVMVLRDESGISRGCAFVTFSDRHMAVMAIRTMHHSMTMEGCSSPLVVKFADTQKDKEQKKVQQIQTNLWNMASVNTNVLGNQGANMTPEVESIQSPQTLAFNGLLGSPLTIGMPSQLLGVPSLLQNQIGVIPDQQSLNGLRQNSLLLIQQQLMQQQQQQQLLGTHIPSSYSVPTSQEKGNYQIPSTPVSQPSNGMFGLGYLPEHQFSAPPVFSQDYKSYPTILQSSQMVTTNGSSHPTDLIQATNFNKKDLCAGLQIDSILKGGKIKGPDGGYKSNPGPEGANLFIYHLPQEFGDSDLHQTFQPFGTIVSAKVFMDKQTSLSKCFGFVSFTTNESAQAAIQAMNGYQVGTKRLKVQLKKPKDSSKPY